VSTSAVHHGAHRLPPDSSHLAESASASGIRPQEIIHAAVVGWLRKEIDPGASVIDYDAPLLSAGLDSVGLAAIALELEKATQTRLTLDILYEHGTINRLAEYIAGANRVEFPQSECRQRLSAGVEPPGRAVGSHLGSMVSSSINGGRLVCADGGETSPHALINEVLKPSVHELLNESLASIQTGQLDDAIWELVSGLRSIRTTASPQEWTQVVATCLAHPITMVLRQEPYTRRGFLQPRGYPGDAALIDYLYLRGPAVGEEVTDLGLALHQVAVRTPAGFSVRSRRNLAARVIDTVADQGRKPSVFAVACGHLREASCSEAVRHRSFGRFLATDQDPESVRVVADEWSGSGIEAQCRPISDMIQKGGPDGRFDLIYALGLYDYLTDEPARVLTRHLFTLLAPGGTLLLANFVPGILEAGYMEAFMRWFLVYRTPEQLRAVCDAPARDVAEVSVNTESLSNISYLTVKRA
jgi:aryl carrier-like protein